MRLGHIQVVDKRYLDFVWNMCIASVAVYLVKDKDDSVKGKTPVRVLKQHERTAHGFDIGTSLEERLVKLVPISDNDENGEESFVRVPPTPISVEYRIDAVPQRSEKKKNFILDLFSKKTTYGCNLIISSSNPVKPGLLFYQYNSFRYPLPQINGEKNFVLPHVSSEDKGKLAVVCLEEDKDRFIIKRRS